jgi:hypothetical protein
MTREIPVTELRIGTTIMNGRHPITVQTITLCTRDHANIHVNNTDCYCTLSRVKVA